MVFGNIFKSQKDRDREEKRRILRATNQLQRGIETLNRKALSFATDIEKAEKTAKKYAAEGKRDMARNISVKIRSYKIGIAKLEMKAAVMDKRKLQAEMAGTQKEFTEAIGQLNSLIEVDPDAFMDVVETEAERAEDQNEIDALWEQLFSQDMTDVEFAGGPIESVDDILNGLEAEVSAEIGGPLPDVEPNTENRKAQLDKINEGIDSLEKLMEKNK